MYTLYEITCVVNGKIYIGYTSKTAEQRLKTHFQMARGQYPKDQNNKLYRAIRKYGEENFVVDVLLTNENKDFICSEERKHIKEMRTIKEGYNTSEGGNGGRTRTPEQIEALRERMTGENNPMYGKPMSFAAKEKFVSYGKLWRESEENKELCRRRFLENNPGKNKSPETIKKISDSKRGLVNKCDRWLITSPEGNTFEIENLAKFAREHNINNLGAVASGKYKTSKGWKCQKLPLP